MTLSADAAFRKDRADGYGRLEHRHFATIAQIIREIPEDRRIVTADHFADRLERTNPRFDRERFLKAAGAL